MVLKYGRARDASSVIWIHNLREKMFLLSNYGFRFAVEASVVFSEKSASTDSWKWNDFWVLAWRWPQQQSATRWKLTTFSNCISFSLLKRFLIGDAKHTPLVVINYHVLFVLDKKSLSISLNSHSLVMHGWITQTFIIEGTFELHSVIFKQAIYSRL